MHPQIAQRLVADRISEWRDLAAQERLLRAADSGRDTAPKPAADLLRPWARLGRRTEDLVTDEEAGMADQCPSGRRAA